jgi:hypothetical protein
LQPFAALLKMSESSFAHKANCDDPACEPHVNGRALKLFGAFLGVLGDDLRNGMGTQVAGRICTLAESFDLLQFVQPQPIATAPKVEPCCDEV